MRLRIEQVTVAERPVRMRLPFQFGSTEVRETAEAYAEVRVQADGAPARGVAAQLMVPRWFDKRAEMSNADTIDELRGTVAQAARLAEGQAGSVASLSAELRQAIPAALPGGTPALAAGFGPALIEMALIDAACLAAGVTFAEAARRDLFGMASLAPADISGERLAAHLGRAREPSGVALRHTIGFDAPLSDGEVGDRPDDDLPVSVEEVIRAYGIHRFKIKLKGNPAADLARLRAIAKLIGGLSEYHVTLDANEQYAPDAFADFLAGLRGTCARTAGGIGDVFRAALPARDGAGDAGGFRRAAGDRRERRP